MGHIYLDSSFLLKLYIQEADTPVARAQMRLVSGQVVISALSHVEVISSLNRRLSAIEGALAKEVYRRNRLAGLFTQVTMPEAVFELALRVAETEAKRYRLKSLDILHLATALHYGVPAVGTFDSDMRAAAVALGLAVLPA